MRYTWIGACALTMLLATAPQRGAEAALVTCAGVTLASVEGASACLYDTGSFNDSEAVVNGAGYFGWSDWTMVGREDSDGKSGGFDFTAYQLGGAQDLMLVFKSGSKKQSPSLIGYLVNLATGDWQTPFTQMPFPNHPEGGRDVSHISYYARNAGEVPPPGPGDVPTSAAAIPEPGIAGLFALGLAGLICLRAGTGRTARGAARATRQA